MKVHSRTITTIVLAIWLVAIIPSCAGTKALHPPGQLFADGRGSVPTDLMPRFGNADQPFDADSDPALRGVLQEATAQHGSARAASRQLSQQGLQLYRRDAYEQAMRAFNHAWALDESNPEASWGFALIYHDHGMATQARRWIEVALDQGLEGAIPYSDAALMLTRMDASAATPSTSEQERILARVRNLLAQAKQLADASNRDYVDGVAVETLLNCREVEAARVRATALQGRGSSLDPRIMGRLERTEAKSKP